MACGALAYSNGAHAWKTTRKVGPLVEGCGLLPSACRFGCDGLCSPAGPGRTALAGASASPSTPREVACRESGKTMVDAMVGELTVTLEKLRWTTMYGEGLRPPLLSGVGECARGAERDCVGDGGEGQREGCKRRAGLTSAWGHGTGLGSWRSRGHAVVAMDLPRARRMSPHAVGSCHGLIAVISSGTRSILL